MERGIQMKNTKGFLKWIFVVFVLIYAVFTFASQQKTLNQYAKTSQQLATQIEEQKEHKEELAKKKEDITSEEYIEDIAREKLDMYLPNEKVYMDTGY